MSGRLTRSCSRRLLLAAALATGGILATPVSTVGADAPARRPVPAAAPHTTDTHIADTHIAGKGGGKGGGSGATAGPRQPSAGRGVPKGKGARWS